MITENLKDPNEINLSLIAISKSDLLNEIEKIVKKYFSTVPQPEPQPQSNFINIDDFCRLNPRKPTRATVYTQLSRKLIPDYLVHRVQGKRMVLFYKDRVLQWIEDGQPTNAQSLADDHVNNRQSEVKTVSLKDSLNYKKRAKP